MVNVTRPPCEEGVVVMSRKSDALCALILGRRPLGARRLRLGTGA